MGGGGGGVGRRPRAYIRLFVKIQKSKLSEMAFPVILESQVLEVLSFYPNI